MKVTPIKTHKITVKDKNILEILDQYLLPLKENTIIAVTSKIVSICEGRIVKIGDIDKDTLIEQESDYFLPRHENKYDVSLTIVKDNLIPTAGIDESNGDGYYILWPHDPGESANRIREYLSQKYSLKNLGVIITDSRTIPLRWGATSIALGYSGFKPLKEYIGKPDIFNKPLEYSRANLIDALAAASAITMGEGGEQTPIAIIEDLPFIEWQDRNPTQEELNAMKISLDDDLYGPLLKSANWQKGKK